MPPMPHLSCRHGEWECESLAKQLPKRYASRSASRQRARPVEGRNP
jgi:hypothetical protein